MIDDTSYYKEFLIESMHLALAMAANTYTQSNVRKFFQTKKTRSNVYASFVGNKLKPKNKNGFIKRLSNEINDIISISKKAQNQNTKSIDERISDLSQELDRSIFLVTTHDENQFFTEDNRIKHHQEAIFSTHFNGATSDEMNINLVFNRQKEFDLFLFLLSKHDLSVLDKEIFFKAAYTFDLRLGKTESYSKKIFEEFPTSKIDVYSELLVDLSLL